MKTWRYYLKKETAIGREMGLSRHTVGKWKSNAHVPPERFKTLQVALAGLNIKLTIEQMGELNDASK